MNERNFQVAFLHPDSDNIASSSGTVYFIYKALLKLYPNIIKIDAYNAISFNVRLKTKLFKLISKYNHIYTYSPSIAKKYKRFYTKELRKYKHLDLIIAPFASIAISQLSTSIPIITINDSGFTQRNNYYPQFYNLSPQCIADSDGADKNAFRKSAHIILSSDWAANSIESEYGISKDKISIIPFGANLVVEPTRKELEHKNYSGNCNMLFIGKDWTRKGGDCALEVFQLVRQIIPEASITFVGRKPPNDHRDENITYIPDLRKDTQADNESLHREYLKADFLLLPSIADCTPIVFCEAFAYGIPVITRNTGGIPFIVENNKTGFALPGYATAKQFCECITSLHSNIEQYNRIKENALMASEKLYNWEVWSQTFKTVINKHILHNECK